MAEAGIRQDFERLVAIAPTSPAELELAAKKAQAGDADAALRCATAISHIAFVDPSLALPVMDALTRGWFGDESTTPLSPFTPAATAEMPGAAFWADFWRMMDEAGGPPNGDETTAKVAALAMNLPKGILSIAEEASIAHPGAAGAATRDIPPRLTLEVLAAQPEGSLGNEFYRLIVDNSFNLEVLDREAAGLASLPPALRYLNTRMLQMHDVWHLMGGYRTTVLQEVSISAFQLAQFGHTYSGMLIAVASTMAFFKSQDSFNLSMQIIAEGWQHGRKTPSFMAIDWESEWHLPIADIRARHGIEGFTSIYPADLVEQMQAAA